MKGQARSSLAHSRQVHQAEKHRVGSFQVAESDRTKFWQAFLWRSVKHYWRQENQAAIEKAKEALIYLALVGAVPMEGIPEGRALF